MTYPKPANPGAAYPRSGPSLAGRCAPRRNDACAARSAEHAARNGRADGTVLADAGALLATADDRANYHRPQPEILYSLHRPAIQMTEVPVLTDGNSERDKRCRMSRSRRSGPPR
jgi:hypothetical protein